MRKLILTAAALLALCACGGKGGETPGPDDKPVEAKTPGKDLFYKGGTMSFASHLQGFGLTYREAGAGHDPYKSMAEHGANCVRLQLDLVEFAKYEGVAIEWQKYTQVAADAARAKEQGMEIVLTLKPDYDIYTDSGTDHNILPAIWAGKSEAQIGEALYDWVYSSLTKLADAGIYPAIVAVGNEVNVGFLRPSASAAADNARTGRLLSYGFKAVRDYAKKNNPACLSALHIANPARAYDAVSAIINAGGSDFDIVALSYYPGKDIGHSLPGGSFANISKFFPEKNILVLETAYSFTTGTRDGKWMGDWCSNAYNYPDWDENANEVNYTPAKGRAWLAALAQDIKAAGGAGLITWGTESLPDLQEGKEQGHGKGLYTYPAEWAYGSTWENNSYWDFTDGNNLHEGIDWMKDVQ